MKFDLHEMSWHQRLMIQLFIPANSTLFTTAWFVCLWSHSYRLLVTHKYTCAMSSHYHWSFLLDSWKLGRNIFTFTILFPVTWQESLQSYSLFIIILSIKRVTDKIQKLPDWSTDLVNAHPWCMHSVSLLKLSNQQHNQKDWFGNIMRAPAWILTLRLGLCNYSCRNTCGWM